MKKKYLLIFVLTLLIFNCKEDKIATNDLPPDSVIIDYSLQRFIKSPLTALAVIDTKIPCKIYLSVKGQDGEDLNKEFPNYSTKHEIPILGLYPDYKNEVTLIAESVGHDTTKLIIPIETKPLPIIFPDLELIESTPKKISDGLYFLYLVKVNGGKNQADYPIAVDKFGKVRWFYYGEYNYILNRVKNNNLVIVENSILWKVYEKMRGDLSILSSKEIGNSPESTLQEIKSPKSLSAKKSLRLVMASQHTKLISLKIENGNEAAA